MAAPALVPTTRSALEPTKPASRSSARSTPTWCATPTRPPAPRTSPTVTICQVFTRDEARACIWQIEVFPGAAHGPRRQPRTGLSGRERGGSQVLGHRPAERDQGVDSLDVERPEELVVVGRAGRDLAGVVVQRAARVTVAAQDEGPVVELPV